MYLLVVKSTGEVVVAKPDKPKPHWGNKESDGVVFEIVHMDDEQFRLGVNNALVGLPRKDACAKGEAILDCLNNCEHPYPCVVHPFKVTTPEVRGGREIRQKVRSVSGVKVDLTDVVSVENDGSKLMRNEAIRSNFHVGSVVIDRSIL